MVPTFAFSNVNKEKLILLLQVFNTVSFFDFLHWRSSHPQSIINYSLLAALPTVRVLIVRPQTWQEFILVSITKWGRDLQLDGGRGVSLKLTGQGWPLGDVDPPHFNIGTSESLSHVHPDWFQSLTMAAPRCVKLHQPYCAIFTNILETVCQFVHSGTLAERSYWLKIFERGVAYFVLTHLRRRGLHASLQQTNIQFTDLKNIIP